MEVSTSQEQPQDRRVSMEPLDASDVPSTRADKLTNGTSESTSAPSLTRLSEPKSESLDVKFPRAG